MKVQVDILKDFFEDEKLHYVFPEGDVQFFCGVRQYFPGISKNRDFLWAAEKEIPGKVEFAYVYPERKEDMPWLLQTLYDFFGRFDDWYERLLMACTEMDGIRKILNIGAEFLKNPVSHVDRFGNTIAYAGAITGDAKDTIWEAVLEKGMDPIDFYTISEWKSFTRPYPSSQSPIVVEAGGNTKHKTACTKIIINDSMIGTVATSEINEPFTGGQLEILKIITEMLARAYSASSNITSSMLNSVTYFDRLACGERVSRKKLHSQMEVMGWKEDGLYRMLSFFPKSEETLPSEYVIHNILKKVPDCAPFKTSGYFGVILPEDTYYELEKESLEKMLEKWMCICIVSPVFRGILDIRTIFQSNLDMQETLKNGGVQKEYFILYEEEYQNVLAMKMLGTEKTQLLVHPVLRKKFREGSQEAQEWLRDLYALLISGRNVKRAAEMRNIHRNTMLYRLEKIQIELNEDFNKISDEEAFYLLFSCILLAKEAEDAEHD